MPHLSYNAAHGTVPERVEALRLLEEYPSQASSDVCLAGLEDSATEVRTQAARCVGASADDRALTSLLDLASAKDQEERTAALEALGRFAPARALSTVEQALADPRPGVQLAAARALTGYVRAGSFDADKLAPLVRSPLVELRLASVALVEALPDTTRRVALLSEAARDQTPEVRATALRALGHVRGPSVLPTLLASLSDRDEAARLSAIAALGDSNLPAAVSPLRALIAADVRVARTALAALGRIDDPGALAAIAPALTRAQLSHGAVNALLDRARRLRDIEPLRQTAAALQRAIEAMSKLAGDSAAKPARASAASTNADAAPNSRPTSAENQVVIVALTRGVTELAAYYDVQALAAGVHSLEPQLSAATEDREPMEQLVRQLDDPDPRVRERSSVALARSADNAALRALAERLEHEAPHPELSLQACAGAMLRASEIPSELRERLLQVSHTYLTQPDETVATSALYALRASRDPRAARWIAGLLRGSSAPLRAAAVQALGDFVQGEARRMLRDMLRGDNAQNASNAAVALAEIGSDRDVEALLRAAERGSWPLPPSAAYAAARIAQRGATRKHSLERVLCRFAQLRDTYVLTNIVAALAALGAEACDAQINPRALLTPALPSALRVAAATWLHNTRPHTPEETAEHTRALASCAADHDVNVAKACAPHAHTPTTRGLTLLRLSDSDAQTPLQNRVVALRFPDATVFIGQSDSAGQLLLRRAEAGPLQLEDPGDLGTVALPTTP
ncbi:MAG TPA: HEAT repeat domain-containing protein [Polyangiales bacterium]|nr:HEAT repeat domain-containing protein [Polyangiales bacterium]